MWTGVGSAHRGAREDSASGHSLEEMSRQTHGKMAKEEQASTHPRGRLTGDQGCQGARLSG